MNDDKNYFSTEFHFIYIIFDVGGDSSSSRIAAAENARDSLACFNVKPRSFSITKSPCCSETSKGKIKIFR